MTGERAFNPSCVWPHQEKRMALVSLVDDALGSPLPVCRTVTSSSVALAKRGGSWLLVQTPAPLTPKQPNTFLDHQGISRPLLTFVLVRSTPRGRLSPNRRLFVNPHVRALAVTWGSKSATRMTTGMTKVNQARHSKAECSLK